ncbi:MAG TPA: hypothetical protein VLF43_03415 [Candidatus Saccharimonadales bacterium]|nr:hypothetical protein [Candidatus Saccharimonadales bacterium]
MVSQDYTDEQAPLACSDKLAFDTQAQAQAAATVAAYQHGATLHTYICKYCGLWHLSSS